MSEEIPMNDGDFFAGKRSGKCFRKLRMEDMRCPKAAWESVKKQQRKRHGEGIRRWKVVTKGDSSDHTGSITTAGETQNETREVSRMQFQINKLHQRQFQLGSEQKSAKCKRNILVQVIQRSGDRLTGQSQSKADLTRKQRLSRN
jgi:hypothetical protein